MNWTDKETEKVKISCERLISWPMTDLYDGKDIEIPTRTCKVSGHRPPEVGFSRSSVISLNLSRTGFDGLHPAVPSATHEKKA